MSIENEELNTKKLISEIDKNLAETSKLFSDMRKNLADTRLIVKKIKWYEYAMVLTGAGIIIALTKLYL